MQTNHRLSDSINSDEQALTSVVEFVAAFVLFLVIVTAFMSLSQLNLGTNNPAVDRLEKLAVESLHGLTSREGVFVPIHNGERDEANATTQWENYNATALLDASLRVGIVNATMNLDSSKVEALRNVTENQLAEGLGLLTSYSMNLTLTIVESPDSERNGLTLFSGGMQRNLSLESATATRLLPLLDEVVRVTLEIGIGGRAAQGLMLTEFMTTPTNGTPEWVEIHNPTGFAIPLTDWDLYRNSHASPAVSASLGESALAAGGVAILTGNKNLQQQGNSSLTIDLGETGVLGHGNIDGLGNQSGSLQLWWSDRLTTTTLVAISVEWTGMWNISAGQSLQWRGGSYSNQTSWILTNGGSPGDYP